jgi:predicted DNA-binding transcriptional regulator YafY
MPNTATRLIHLIMLLQQQPNQKAADLAAELGVSVRTLYRYFEMLDEMGIPIYSERGPYGGFSLVRGYRMPPLVLTPEEAVAVALGTGMVEELWGELYRESARAALAKLEHLLPNEQKGEVTWARRTLIATGMHRGDLEALIPRLETLRRAVREHRRVNMHYRSASSPHPSQRDLDPYALIHRWGWWYVIGFCRLRGAVRSFRVDRIENLQVSDHVFQNPVGFDVQAYLAQDWGAPPQVTVRMRFGPQDAHVALFNRAYWETVSEEPDGSAVVTFSAPEMYWAASTVMAYGPIVEVLEPPALQIMLGKWAHAISDLYKGKDRT